MRKVFFFFLAAAALRLEATPVDSLEARGIAQQFFRYMNPTKSSVAIVDAVATHYRGTITRYTFIFENNDFIMIAANDAAVPVLAWSRQQSYAGEDVSPELAWWLETEYDQWIYSLQNKDGGPSATREEWRQIREGRYSGRSTEGILPMITSRWGQSRTNDHHCPGYNDKVPAPSMGCSCDKCTAGCVAVAMAQIMNFWHYPESNEERIFDWCHMPDQLLKLDGAMERPEFAVECNAISGLLVNCGARANLNYCVSGCATGSTIGQAGSAIQGPYGYSPDMQHRYRTLTTGWKNKLRESLDNGMPVLYGGQSSTGGHAFVCDGYESEDYFHFNWGWTGSYDGYFYITAGDGSPEIEYDGLQEALFFIHPGSSDIKECLSCDDTLLVSNRIEPASYNPAFPNIVWSGLSPLYNYNHLINPYVPAKSTIVDGNGTQRLQYEDIAGGTIVFDQVIIPDRVNVALIAYREIELNNFETDWGAEFSAEIVECNVDKRPLKPAAFNDDSNNETSPDPVQTGDIGIQIYPNPASGILHVTFYDPEGGAATLIIRDIQGHEWLRNQRTCTQMDNQFWSIPAGQLSPGLYFAEIISSSGIRVKKFIVE